MTTETSTSDVVYVLGILAVLGLIFGLDRLINGKPRPKG